MCKMAQFCLQQIQGEAIQIVIAVMEPTRENVTVIYLKGIFAYIMSSHQNYLLFTLSQVHYFAIQSRVRS